MRKLLLSIIVLVFAVSISAKPRPKDTPKFEQDDQHTLNQWYFAFNHQYFQDELPNDVIITRTLNDDRFMALTFENSEHYHIAINPKYNISTKSERIDLLHEMCHVQMFIENDYQLDDHGSHWQACMHRLANQGAFENLW